MLGYGEDDTDAHLSSICRESEDVRAPEAEGDLSVAVYAMPHRNQVSLTFQNFFCALLTYRKLCRVHQKGFSFLSSAFNDFCLGADFHNMDSLIFFF